MDAHYTQSGGLFTVDRVQAQQLATFAVPAVAERLENRAVTHAVLVDVQGNRDLVGTWIADGVVFMRRDDAAGGADAARDRGESLEAAAIGLIFQ